LQAKVSLPELINPHVLRAKIMAKKKLENLSFEESLNELDTIVQSLEQGELSLEESMALFERGLNLSQLSQVKLQAAEQKVQILLEKNGTAKLSDFDSSVGES
jgi:exodeoxyribonuclease VII small subunit